MHAFGCLPAVFLDDSMRPEAFKYLLAGDMYSRHNNMTRGNTQQLKDSLAKISLHYFNTIGSKTDEREADSSFRPGVPGAGERF